MSATTSQRPVLLPTSGVTQQEVKGQPHHAHHVREMVRNLNYLTQHRIPPVICATCLNGGDLSEGNPAYESTATFAGTGPLVAVRGRCPIYQPHAANLTVSYAIRCEQRSLVQPDGTMIIFVCDSPWDGTSPPGGCNYVSETRTITAGATYGSGGTGTARGEYLGSIAVTFPLSADLMLYVYVIVENITSVGTVIIWATGGTP